EEQYSRFVANDSLQEYFVKQNIVAIDGIDTRALVIHIRNQGAMNCIISSDNNDVPELKMILARVPSMNGLELASTVSTKKDYTLGDEKSEIRIAVLDFGIKKNILNCLLEKGAYIKVFNAGTSFSELENFKPH